MRPLLDLHKENRQIVETLLEEMQFVTELTQVEPSSLRYRVFMRSGFSHIEAMVWIIKQTTLAYALSNNGILQESRARITFLANLQFALRFASEVFGDTFELDKRLPH